MCVDGFSVPIDGLCYCVNNTNLESEYLDNKFTTICFRVSPGSTHKLICIYIVYNKSIKCGK